MASQQDLQELLRLLTVSRKVPMLQAMGQIKALQAVNLKSIKDISSADLVSIQTAIKDEKQAKALQSACKAVLKRGDTGSGSKRAAPSSSSPSESSKRTKHSATNDLLPGLSPHDQLSPQELESSLALPVNTDEDLISATTLETNRAPLVLAFAAELLRYTMPEQPPSSRLSLAQAVVSANSRSKAVSLGIEKGPAAEDEGWGEGQPKVKIMGREVAVLKRGGYRWKGDEEIAGTADESTSETVPAPEPEQQEKPVYPIFSKPSASSSVPQTHTWSPSPRLSLRQSTFLAHSTLLPPSQSSSRPSPASVLSALLTSHPHLKSATHNAWASRTTHPTGQIAESSHDDGETGAGALILRVMRELGATDTMVVMSRWFGGVMLGPDRWRLMRNVVVASLTERLKRSGGEVATGGEAVWGLDLEGMRKGGRQGRGGYGMSEVVGMQIHSPQGARAYLMKSFGSVAEAEEGTGEGKRAVRKTVRVLDGEREENLGLVLGALRLLFDSWADHLGAAELDRRAWSWYVAVRPAVESGPGGWGAKGRVKLGDILKLRRAENA